MIAHPPEILAQVCRSPPQAPLIVELCGQHLGFAKMFYHPLVVAKGLDCTSSFEVRVYCDPHIFIILWNVFQAIEGSLKKRGSFAVG
jgi:hypothetical protein